MRMNFQFSQRCKRVFLPIFFILLVLFHPKVMAKFVSQEDFINKMVTQHGFDEFYLTQLLEQAKVRQSIVKLMSRPQRRGKPTPWYRYRRIFLTDDRIDGGVNFWRKYAPDLQRAQATYGVPPEIITAIIGVETFYGKITGGYRVIDALTTLSFHYLRRADFFREELEHFLILTREEGLDPLTLEGSYAGAMGLGQFMPSSFRNYAVDFDGDGKRDIWNNYIDAIGSVANYFSRHGWRSGGEIIKATQIRPDAIENLLSLDFKPKYTLKYLKRLGLRYHGNQSDNTPAMFLDLETEQGMAYWVGFNNYYVITRYNRSKRYATAVYQLSEAIAYRYYGRDR